MRWQQVNTAQTGFTYLAVLFAIVILSAGLAQIGIIWHQAQQREKEQELLFIGHQFRQAIAMYYNRTPGTVKKYPTHLEDLQLDKRYLTIQRYLRRIYVDPMTGKATWGTLAAPDGGIMGVYSLSKAKPIKTAGFSKTDAAFTGKKSYSDWIFFYSPPSSLPH